LYLISWYVILLCACGRNFEFRSMTCCLDLLSEFMYVIIDTLDKDWKASGRNIVILSISKENARNCQIIISL